MFEAIYGFALVGIVIYLFVNKSGERDVQQFHVAVDLEGRLKKIEEEVRYRADQPAYQPFLSLSQYNADWNVVPINSVVRAIVKHLGMEIEQKPAETINKPQEVNVVEKKPNVAISTAGVTGTTWVAPCQPPTPKPKRKYTKRKTNGQKAKTQKGK